jgi:hypothetical protein
MDEHSIDASIGLGFSLELFKKYRSTGILQAKVRRFPGVQGPAIVSLYLVEGMVVSCYVEDKDKQHSPASTDVLIRFDNEKGPFEWNFRSSSPALTPVTPPPISAVQPYTRNTGPLSSHVPTAIVSRIASSLPGEQLLGLTLQQRRMFLLVWKEIDGKRTIQDIKVSLSKYLSEDIVDNILRTLLKSQLIMISK